MKKEETIPSSGKEPKSEILHMRISKSDKELLRLITEGMDEASDTQTVIKLIREKARFLKIALPRAGA